MEPETMQVVHPDDAAQLMIINASDFNPTIHQPLNPMKKTKPVKESVSVSDQTPVSLPAPPVEAVTSSIEPVDVVVPEPVKPAATKKAATKKTTTKKPAAKPDGN